MLAQNLEYGNADSDLLVDEVLRRDVDVLVLTEVDAAYLVRLADSPLGQRLPHDSGPVRPGGAPGTAVLSRYPMRVLDAEWPQYGLAAHKGYPTAAHLAALEAHGVRDFYRRSFGPVKRLLSGGAGR